MVLIDTEKARIVQATDEQLKGKFRIELLLLVQKLKQVQVLSVETKRTVAHVMNLFQMLQTDQGGRRNFCEFFGTQIFEIRKTVDDWFTIVYHKVGDRLRIDKFMGHIFEHRPQRLQFWCFQFNFSNVRNG